MARTVMARVPADEYPEFTIEHVLQPGDEFALILDGLEKASERALNRVTTRGLSNHQSFGGPGPGWRMP